MSFWADLHVHSTFSDGHHTPEELVHFYGKLGCGAIAITDHYADEQSFFGKWAHRLNRSLSPQSLPMYFAEIYRVAKIAKQKYNMLVLPGFEITRNSLYAKKSSHYLVIGSNRPLCPNTDLEAALAEYKKQQALLIAAHPLATGRFEFQTLELWSKRKSLAKYFDAWEVNCAQLYYQAVADSGLPIIASSDLHHKKQINSYKTIFDCLNDKDSLFQAIKQQELEVVSWNRVRQRVNASKRSLKMSFKPQALDSASLLCGG